MQGGWRTAQHWHETAAVRGQGRGQRSTAWGGKGPRLEPECGDCPRSPGRHGGMRRGPQAPGRDHHARCQVILNGRAEPILRRADGQR